MFPGASRYVVLSKKQETPTTSTLSLAKTDGTIPDHKPGQCITVYFPDLSPTLGKQYSISSAPCENMLTITVKAIGRFSHKICALREGDIFLASDPSGDFYPKTAHIIIMMAGGMGITPFRSIILQTLAQSTMRRVALFYSGKTRDDMPFSDELYELSKTHPSLFVERFVTQEAAFAIDAKYRRMRFDDICNFMKTDSSPSSEFLISGSLSFVLGQKAVLVENGVSRSLIQTESYF